MRLLYLALFLTLVLEVGMAAPNDSFIPSPINPQIKEDLSLDSTKIYPSFDMDMNYFVISYGLLTGAFDKDKEIANLNVAEIAKGWRISADEAFETGIAGTSNNLLGVDLSYSTRCCYTSFMSEERPYYKAGLFLSVDPKDKLANFIDYQRLFLELATGVYSFSNYAKYFGAEVGARAGYAGSHIYALVRYRF